MSYREKRLITLLGGILGILFLAVLLLLGIRYRQNRPEPIAAASSGEVAEIQTGYTELTYYTEEATLSFRLDEAGQWLWAHDEGFPLSQHFITDLLDTLDTMTPQQTLTEMDVDSCGLTDPWAGLTVSRGDGTETTLYFGNATTDGTSYYARFDDSETIYIYADTLVRCIETPIYDLYDLPVLPELTADRLRRITVQGALSAEGQERITIDQTDGAWIYGGRDVTDNSRLTDLLSDIAALQIEQCVDYRPSAKALTICGFDDPAATLWVKYAAEAEEATFQITVGTLTLDGAARYVRLAGDGLDGEVTIFRINTEQLDALALIALSGLEG